MRLAIVILTLLLFVSSGEGAGLAAEDFIRQLNWCRSQAMLTARYQASATKLNDGRILVVGGRGKGAKYLATAEIFNPVTGDWSQAGQLSEERYYHTATLLPDGRVLIAGGINPKGILVTTELFDPNANSWKTVGPMKNSRRKHSAFLSADGYVYVVGGGAPYEPLASVEKFNISSEKWSIAPSMPFGQSNAAIAGIGGLSFYNIGGYRSDLTASNRVNVYDVKNAEWRVGVPMLLERDYLSVDVFGNLIVAIGGVSGEKVLNSIEAFDLSSEQWVSMGSLLLPTFGHRTVVIQGIGILVVGGVGQDMVLSSRVELSKPGRASILAPSISVARYGAFLVSLNDGRILIGGGAARFNGDGETWLANTEITCAPMPLNTNARVVPPKNQRWQK